MKDKFSKRQIDEIFIILHTIYRDVRDVRDVRDGTLRTRVMDFDWKTYQLPTLIAITSNYVNYVKVK